MRTPNGTAAAAAEAAAEGGVPLALAAEAMEAAQTAAAPQTAEIVEADGGQWLMDGRGKGIKGRRSAALRRQAAADENGDTWMMMTRNYHRWPGCPFKGDDKLTLDAMFHDVYTCRNCEFSLSMRTPSATVRGRLRWADVGIE